MQLQANVPIFTEEASGTWRQPEVTQTLNEDPGPHLLTDSEYAKLVPAAPSQAFPCCSEFEPPQEAGLLQFSPGLRLTGSPCW